MISRREFVTNVAATTAAVTIVPRHVLGKGYTPPSDRLNIAGIGVGGMGRTNLLNLGLDNNIVALVRRRLGIRRAAVDRRRVRSASSAKQKRLLKTDLTPEARKNSEHRVASLKRIAAEDLAEASSATPTTA